MPDPEFLGRLVAVETRQADDRRELERLRDKVHLIDKAVGAVSLLTAEIARVHADLSAMRNDFASLRQEIPALARTSAQEAINVALERRDELHADRRREWRDGLSLRGQLVSVAVGLAGLAYVLIDTF